MSGTQDESKGTGGARRPVDAKTRTRVRKLAREGRGRNAIAREVGISPSTVSMICAEARPPITFDRTASAVAVQARVVDLKARRQVLAERVLSEAIAQLDKLSQPHEVINWHEGMMSRDTIDQPTSGDVKNYATAAAILIDKHLVLIRHDSEGGELSGLDRFLDHLMPGRATDAA
jgi:predicted transcriptional regulator